MNRDNSKKIAVTFIVFTFLFTFFRTSISSVFSLYYSSIGIAISDISWIKSFQNIGLLIGLIPSGILADRIGRVKIINLSSVMIAISFSLIYISSNLYVLAGSELLYGLGLSFNTGTLLSYINALAEEFNVNLEDRVVARRSTMITFASLISGGSELFKYNIKYPLILSIIGLILYPILFILWLRYCKFNDNKSSDIVKKENLILNSVGVFKQKRTIFIAVISSLFEAGIQFLLIYWSVYFVEQLHYELFMVYALSMIAFILGTEIFVYTKKQKIIFNNQYIPISLLAGSVMTIGFYPNKLIKLLALVLAELLMGYVTGQITVLQNDILKYENNKSTLLSGVGFIVEVFVIVVMMFNKVLLNIYTLEQMFIFSGFVLLLMNLVLLIYEKRGKK